MSKKTRKKSSKPTSTGKVKKAKTAKPVAARTSTASSAANSAKKATAKRAAAKAAPPKKTTARATKSKQVATQVRVIGTLVEGKPAPEFSLPRDGGQLVSLSAYAGRKLVIFFYPRADTPGCTLEAVAFSRLANAFAAAQTAVLGVSADPVSAQEAFRDKHELTVPLVSDEKLGMLKAYGVWGEKSMYGKTFMGIVRTTVLVDSSGKIVRVWRNVRVNGHADEVLAAARIC